MDPIEKITAALALLESEQRAIARALANDMTYIGSDAFEHLTKAMVHAGQIRDAVRQYDRHRAEMAA